MRTGTATKIAFVDQGYLDAARGKCGGRNGTVDSGAQYKHIETAPCEFADVVLTQA